jgi:hypothetical protein
MQNLLSKCNTKVCNQPAPVTFVGVLNACASVVALEEGRHAHELEDMPSTGFLRKLFNVLNRCVKKVYSQMIPLLCVSSFQLAAMQV